MKAATHQQMGTSQPTMNLQAGGREGSGAREGGRAAGIQRRRRGEAGSHSKPLGHSCDRSVRHQ